MSKIDRREFAGVHVALTIARLAPRVVMITLAGNDVGELEDAPFHELEKDLAQPGQLTLFIDARDVRGASVDVSDAWARWLHRHHHRLARINMLTGSRFVQITAEFVRRYTGLEESMELFSDAEWFDAAALAAVAIAKAGEP